MKDIPLVHMHLPPRID